MSRMRLIVGTSEWGIDDHVGDVAGIVASIENAMRDGEVVKLPLLDGAGRRVTVYYNGRTGTTLTLDFGDDSRPGTISPG